MLNTILIALRLKQPSVASVLETFNRASAQLAAVSDAQNAEADRQFDAADRARAAAHNAMNEADRADRVAAKLADLIA